MISNSDPYTYVGHRPHAHRARRVARRRAHRHRDAARCGARRRARRRRAVGPDRLLTTSPEIVQRRRRARRSRSTPTRRSRGRSTATTWARSTSSSITYAPDCLSRSSRPERLEAASSGDVGDDAVDARVAQLASCVGVVHRPHVDLQPWSWARVTRPRRRSLVSVHTSGWTAVCRAQDRGHEHLVEGGIPNDSNPVGSVGRELVDPVDDVGSRTTTPAPGRARTVGEQARPARRRLACGSLISTFTSRPRHTSSTSARVGTSGGSAPGPSEAPPGGARRGGPRAGRRRCGARRAPRRRRPARPPAPWRGTVFSGASRLAPRWREHEHRAHHAHALARRAEIPGQPLARGRVRRRNSVSGSSAPRFGPGTPNPGHVAHNWGNEAWH